MSPEKVTEVTDHIFVPYPYNTPDKNNWGAFITSSSCLSCGKLEESHLYRDQAEPEAVFEPDGTLQTWIWEAHQNAIDHGFHDEPLNIDQKVLLIIGELIEFQEFIRSGHAPQENWFDKTKDNKPDGPAIELIDAMIRLWDLFGALEMLPSTVEALLTAKHNYNVTRRYKHDRKF